MPRSVTRGIAVLLWQLRAYELAQRLDPTVIVVRKPGPPRTVERLRRRVETGNWDRPL
jgi:hypothetical protein